MAARGNDRRVRQGRRRSKNPLFPAPGPAPAACPTKTIATTLRLKKDTTTCAGYNKCANLDVVWRKKPDGDYSQCNSCGGWNAADGSSWCDCERSPEVLKRLKETAMAARGNDRNVRQSRRRSKNPLFPAPCPAPAEFTTQTIAATLRLKKDTTPCDGYNKCATCDGWNAMDGSSWCDCPRDSDIVKRMKALAVVKRAAQRREQHERRRTQAKRTAQQVLAPSPTNTGCAFCSECGAGLKGSGKFCSACGAKQDK